VGTDEKLKYPSEFVTDLRMSPELSFLIMTLAFGITEPDASVTTPVNVAKMDCALTGAQMSPDKSRIARQRSLAK